MNTAADLIRQALADAPDGLHVERDYDGLWVFSGGALVGSAGEDDWQATMRLVGLLLAAAPHVVDLLSLHYSCNCAPDDGLGVWAADCAITEAAQAMEAES